MTLMTILKLVGLGLACFILGGYLFPASVRAEGKRILANLRTPKGKRIAKEQVVEVKDDWKHDPICRNTRAAWRTAAAPMTSPEDQSFQPDETVPSAARDGSETSADGPTAESGPQVSLEGEGSETEDAPEGEGLEGAGTATLEPEGRLGPGSDGQIPDRVVGVNAEEGIGEGESAQPAGSPFTEEPPAGAPSAEIDEEKAKRLLRKKGFSVIKRDTPPKKRRRKNKRNSRK